MSVHEHSSGLCSQDEAMSLRKLEALSILEGKTAQKRATDVASSCLATASCSTTGQEQVQVDSEQTATPRFAAVAFASEVPALAFGKNLDIAIHCEIHCGEDAASPLVTKATCKLQSSWLPLELAMSSFQRLGRDM